MPDRRYRVLVVASHPVQYMAPVLRRMAVHPALDLQVVYCTLRGAEAGHDPEFGASIQWDIPLLDGYTWSQPRNRGSGAESFFGLFNPGVWKHIRRGNFDAVLAFTGYLRATFWITLLAAKFSKTAFLFGTDTATLAPRDGRPGKAVSKKILWPRLFRLADQAIVPSSGSRNVILSLGIIIFGFGGYLLLRHRRGRLFAFLAFFIAVAGIALASSRSTVMWSSGSTLIGSLAFFWGAPWRQREVIRVLRTVQMAPVYDPRIRMR
jgi:hypothetical protein